MNDFWSSNDVGWRLARTIVQGFIGVILANADLIVGYAVLDPTTRALIVAFVIAALTPVFKAIGDAMEEAENSEAIDTYIAFQDILDDADDEADK